MPHVDFLGVGDFGVSTRADTVFPPRVVCVFWKRGRAYRELDYNFNLPHLAHGVIFYFFNIEMSSTCDV